jgi:hypothetical protein
MSVVRRPSQHELLCALDFGFLKDQPDAFQLLRVVEQKADSLRSRLGRAPVPSLTELLADHLIRHSRTFKKPLPTLDSDKNGPRVILDPNQSAQMVIKLFELETSMLSDLWRSVEQGASDAARANNAVDFTPRYFSAACRELNRAIAHYMYLKENKL